MNFAVSRVSRRVVFASSVLAIAAATAPQALAQTVIQSDIPLSEVCTVQGGSLCATPVIGTRTVTPVSAPTVTAVPGGLHVVGNSVVNFNGQLQVDGLKVNSTNTLYPSFLLAPLNSDLTITGAANYNVHSDYNTSPTGLTANSGFTFTNNSLAISSLGVNIANRTFNYADGTEGQFSLSSINPAAISANGTALSGTFSSSDGKVVFGTLTGTATVQSPAGPITMVPTDGTVLTDGSGNTYTTISPYELAISVTPTVQTQLDATGLITPTVTVTNGIEMNGSTITGLAAGTAPTDAVNKGQLDAEAATRAAADTALQTSIATETAARTAADTTLQANINSEATTRAAADTVLQANIGAEATTRAQADLALSQRITSEEAARSALTSQITSEANARAQADLAMQSQVNTLGSRVDQLQSQVALLDSKIASSTAVAVAMSGNTFLPGTHFNLTANVGTYDGAHAGSLQIGALISDHVAINAGVATGFNKGGKTAGRVGVTFGW